MAFSAPDKYRLTSGRFGTQKGSGPNGAFKVGALNVIASDGQGWEHVSVSTPNKIPTWSNMCFIKDLFWEEEDTVIQYHPPKSEYVNIHKYCLHLWRKEGREVETPPYYMVGPKVGGNL